MADHNPAISNNSQLTFPVKQSNKSVWRELDAGGGWFDAICCASLSACLCFCFFIVSAEMWLYPILTDGAPM